MLNSIKLNNNTPIETNLLGHRGARGEAFENSRHGFEHLLKIAQQSNGKVSGIEFDVQLTRDNHFVIFHDDSLSRLFRQQSRVDQLTYYELTKRLGFTNDFMLLNDVTTLLSEFKHIELEIKTHPRTNHLNLMTALANTLNQPIFHALPIILTSFDTHLLHLMRTRPFLSRFKKGLLVEPIKGVGYPFFDNQQTAKSTDKTPFHDHSPQVLQQELLKNRFIMNLPNFARQLGCEHLGLHYSLCNLNIINQCRRLDLSTSAWTVNEPQEVFRLIDLEINHIITDYPSRMLTLFN